MQYLLGEAHHKQRLPAKPDYSHMKKVTEKYGTAAPRQAVGDIKYDRKSTFDKETDVYYSGATHEESQPSLTRYWILISAMADVPGLWQSMCEILSGGVYEMTVDESTGSKTLK
jgi:hypothetical protein